MRMSTEEAFVKVLQRHAIEHAFGIIGSAYMPVSDLFERAGITFWDVAHESNGALMCDGFTRSTGAMGNGDSAERARRHRLRHRGEDRLLEPHADACSSPRKPPTRRLASAVSRRSSRWRCSATSSATRKKCAILRACPKFLTGSSSGPSGCRRRRRSISRATCGPRSSMSSFPRVLEFERPAGGFERHRRGGAAPLGGQSSRSSSPAPRGYRRRDPRMRRARRAARRSGLQ